MSRKNCRVVLKISPEFASSMCEMAFFSVSARPLQVVGAQRRLVRVRVEFFIVAILEIGPEK